MPPKEGSLIHKHFTYTLITILLLAAMITGCSSDVDRPNDAEPMTGLANPASVYCLGLGYDEETRENPSGQYGVCLFPDGTECDTWDFLAGRCGKEHNYCVQQGFILQAVEDGNIATCIFDDGSTCGEYPYYEGDCKPGESMP